MAVKNFVSALSLLVMLLGAGPVVAQTSLSPPAVKWAGHDASSEVPTPVQIIGYDSGTGLPCIVGSTATCKLSTTGGAGGGGDASAANQATQITAEQAIQATLGAISGAAVITDANGTAQQYLRGLVKLWAANPPATSAKQDTQITAEQAIQATLGATSGAAVITDANGTAQQYLRGLVKLWIAGGLGVNATPASMTPTAPNISTVTTGGTAVNAFSAGNCSKGCYIMNPDGAAQPLCVNGIATASGTTTAGALICLTAGRSIYLPPRSTAVSVVSSDSSHAFGGEGYN